MRKLRLTGFPTPLKNPYAYQEGVSLVPAKARGVAFGRPKKMRPDQQQVARELVRDGKSISAVARTFDVHPATIYRVIGG